MSDPPPSSTPPPPVVVDAALRNATKEDIARIEQLLKKQSSIPSEPVVTTTPPVTVPSDDQIELGKYRETERQTILKEMPKEVIEEFKLTEKPLKRVKEISKLRKAVMKGDVGVSQPPPSSDVPGKKYQTNPLTGKYELC